MTKSFEALVTASLGSLKSIEDKIKALGNTEIVFNNFQTSGITKEFEKSIKNAFKSIKFDVSPNVKTSGTTTKLVSEYKSAATKAKNALNSAFKGLSFAESIDFDEDKIQQTFKSLEAQVKKISGMKLDWNWDYNDLDHITAKLTNAQGVVQEFSYTLRQVGNSDIYLLDPANLSVITDANKQIDSLTKKLATLRGNIEVAKGSQISSDQYDSLIKNAKAFESQLKQVASQSGITQQQINELMQDYAQLNGQYRNSKLYFSNAQRASNIAKTQEKKDVKELTTLYHRLNEFMAKNKKAQSFGNLSQLQSQLQSMKQVADITGTVDHEAFAKLKGDIESSVSSARQLGITGETAFERVANKAKELGTYLMTSMVFMYTAEGIKAMVDNVIELDTAMTELKKTTDGSAASYSQFLTESASIAQEVGAKISDVVQSAAEWSRSGFNLSEVAGLSRAANMYMNVSEYDNISDATSSLIATMKAYGVESQNVTSIVDAFNAVSNTQSITANGLGDSMLRAASALSVAGNSMEESLGLIVAANDTVQNPEKVGGVLPTLKTAISVKLRGRTRPRKDYQYFVGTPIREGCAFVLSKFRRKHNENRILYSV